MRIITDSTTIILRMTESWRDRIMQNRTCNTLNPDQWRRLCICIHDSVLPWFCRPPFFDAVVDSTTFPLRLSSVPVTTQGSQTHYWDQAYIRQMDRKL